MRGLRIMILLVLPVLLIGCGGLNKTVVKLHPITPKDIFVMTPGQVYTTEKSGYFLSDFYVREVMDVKVGSWEK